MPKPQVTIPLEIPDIQVLKCEINKAGELVITVESTKASTVCSHCGKMIRKIHGYDAWVEIRYLPVFGHPTYLRYRPKRFRCDDCDGQPTTTQNLDWHEPKSPNTYFYEQHVLLQLVNATIEDVSIKENLSYDRVHGILERQISEKVDWSRFSQIGTLGIDEIALKKGHRNFVAIVTARQGNRISILAVLPDREKATVVDFLRSIPERLKKTISTACTDMYEGYTEAIREELSHVRLVIDRFHVTRAYRDCLDEVRKVELRRLKKELPAAEYALLKGSLWALRRHKQDLSPEEKKNLAKLFSLSADIKKAYDLQNELTAIFDAHISISRAKARIVDWIEKVASSGLSYFDSFLKTLASWMDPILNYFIARENSGFVEGFNNKIKVLKRRCYGITNIHNLFRRIYLDLEGYRLFA